MADRTQLDVLLQLDDRVSAPMNRAFGGINNNVVKTRGKFTRAFSGMSDIARRFGLVLGGVGIALAFKNIVDKAIEFESAFAGVQKTVDATGAEFAQLKEGLLDLSTRIPVAAKDLARIQELAGQLGVRGVKNLEKFTETIAKIAVTTDLTREAAATNFARIANIMQEPLRNVDRMGASIVDLGNNFATTEPEITEFANRIAGAGKVVGLSTADIFAFGAAFSSVGVRAERGGTAVSKSLIMIGDAVTQGGSQLQRFADIAGLTSEEFARKFQEDAGKAFALFIEGLGKSGLEGANILKQLELGDQKLIQSFLSVGGATGILSRALDKSNDAWRANTALTEEANKRFNTTASQIQLFKNNIDAATISLADSFLPALNKVLQLITPKENKGVVASIRTWNSYLQTLDENRKNYELIIRAQQQLTKELEEGGVKLDGTSRFMEEFGGKVTFAHGEVQGIDEALKALGLTLDDLKNDIDQNVIDIAMGKPEETEEDPAIIAAQKKADRISEIEVGLNAFIAASRSKLTKTLIKFNKKEFKSEEEKAAAKKALQEYVAQNAIATGLTMLHTLAQHNKAAAIAFKAIQVGRAIINTSEAVTEALPNIPLAALVGAMGAAEIATIMAQEFHSGGLIKNNNLTSDEIPIIAQTGEGILSRRGMTGLGGEENLNRLNSGKTLGNSFHITINVDAVLSNEMDIPLLAEELGLHIEREVSRARTIG